MGAQVRLSVIQRKILKIFVNTDPEVTFCIWMQFWCQEKEFVHTAIPYSYKNSKNKSHS